jgi:hypothetical protein
MSQHDYDIAVGDANTGPTMRAAINGALRALASNNLGATVPSTTYAGMWWGDTTSDTLWQRNAANNAWIDKGQLSVAIRIGVATGNIPLVNQSITATTRAATTTFATSLNHTLSDTDADIAAFNGVAGVTYHCRALGTGEITQSAGLDILQSGASIETAADDTFDVYMLTTTTCEIRNFQRASGEALSGGALVTSTGISINAYGSGVWGDVASITLDPGTWDVSCMCNCNMNGATMVGQAFICGIGTASGTATTGLVAGDTMASAPPPAAGYSTSGSVISKEYTVTVETTLYLKAVTYYSAGNPLFSGRIRARKIS